MVRVATYSRGVDTPELRKARGAFFTPPAITSFIADWAIQQASDRVLEPSAGDAEFMVAVVDRLRSLGEPVPGVDGIEIHEASADAGRRRVEAAGGVPSIQNADFFDVPAHAGYEAVVGNPPYIRYQDFSGGVRDKARAAAQIAGVGLSGLASSWAAFTVYSTLFLRRGGRLGLVVPAELLSVNYAGPVREYLMEKFSDVRIVMFDHQVFEEAEIDAVLLIASGWEEGPTREVHYLQVGNADELVGVSASSEWERMETGAGPQDKWTIGREGRAVADLLGRAVSSSYVVPLEAWGDTTLGAVTGNNRYFAISPGLADSYQIPEDELVRLSPPGSRHLRGLEFSLEDWRTLGENGKATYLFRPGVVHSVGADEYLRTGMAAGVHNGYKCRTRKVWYQTPLGARADLFLTYMNADTPRLVANSAQVHHLNSIHGVFLTEPLTEMGTELLPLAALNSLTILHAELTGRSYGGGVLKIEPKEADRWLLPSPTLIAEKQEALRSLRGQVSEALAWDGPVAAAMAVDDILFQGLLSASELAMIRETTSQLSSRRATRGKR